LHKMVICTELSYGHKQKHIFVFGRGVGGSVVVVCCVPFVHWKLQLERPLRLDIQLRKVGRISQPRLRNPRWLLRASTAVIYRFLALLSICVSLKQSYTQYCPTSICGHVATVFVCANCQVICCYQLVLLAMANLASVVVF